MEWCSKNLIKKLCYEFGERRNWHHNVFWQKMILNISQQMWVHWIVGNHIYVQNPRDYSSTHNWKTVTKLFLQLHKISFLVMLTCALKAHVKLQFYSIIGKNLMEKN